LNLLLSREFWAKEGRREVYSELEMKATNADRYGSERTSVRAVIDMKMNMDLNQGASKAMVHRSRASKQFRMVTGSSREAVRSPETRKERMKRNKNTEAIERWKQNPATKPRVAVVNNIKGIKHIPHYGG
jgi:hypothetical protein